MKTSLEVEYWVVDTDGDLVAPETLLDVSPGVDPEFVEPMLEIKTTPCESMPELREELLGRIERVADAARRQDKRLVPLATPLSASPAEVPYRETAATDLQRRIVGPTFDDARVCAGTHLHIEQSSVADQLNALTAIDPAFALVTSASHYRGERLHQCARPFLYRRSCYGPCPEQGQLRPYVDSVADWERRLEADYETFRERALERGVDPARFDEAFDPHEAAWNPVRLRKAMPTVEWRSPDAALPSQVLRLASEVRSVVARADANGTVVDDGSGSRTASDAIVDSNAADEPLRLPAFDTVESVTDAAIRDGLEGTGVRHYLRGLGFTPADYDPIADHMPDGRLTDREAKRLRLRAADRLEADLERRRARAP
ncbi:glutamate-cysteine ligase family protein [Natrinema thermotolerans]|uniref:Glutamate-cysteine ligase family protein n=1 Tax=Natrinema thermotolerans TaxID=121872 RepID=A0AAF0PIE7_9EURY|nr:glutamate-cysteine ligase family protein [Natrinema thermotolerans]QCC58680.1 glutamate--cysteine ligase [Natrinema thermotolerans]WMT09830.1 glutamate-cysteine ligase family protein [Natrinema thermotolerans]